MINPAKKRFDINLKTIKKQVTIETFRSRGPGGQRKNKTETAVRLRHLPSGITLIAKEHRSQAQNLKLAFERLKDRLMRLNQPEKKRIPTSVPMKAILTRKEEKRIISTKKRLRQNIPKEEKWD